MNSLVGGSPAAGGLVGSSSLSQSLVNPVRKALLEQIESLELTVKVSNEKITKLKAVLDIFPDPLSIQYTQTGNIPQTWGTVN